ncbi:uncharacterized protein LOC117121764 [Anneissia japonica]|uniref:uncharacterized protein LOC117121764 n=1 Tax=Anneissia japonica TaxID=1529436 RepID=UPI0014258B17|nr:uncharacterized protein LOC117121764 [Anneissia japonica]
MAGPKQDTDSEESGIKQECRICNELVSLSGLRDHIAACTEAYPIAKDEVEICIEDEDDDLLYDLSISHINASYDPILEPPDPTSSISSTFTNTPLTSAWSRHISDYVNIVDEDPLSSDEDDEIQVALQQSLVDLNRPSDENADVAAMQDGDRQFQNKLHDEVVEIIIRRKRIWKSTIDTIGKQKDFDFLKSPHIHLSGEEGVDFGGPKRELFGYSVKHTNRNPLNVQEKIEVSVMLEVEL